MNKKMKIGITITESITEEHIDSILLETDNMHKDIEWVFTGDIPVKDKMMEFSKLYGIPWEYYTP